MSEEWENALMYNDLEAIREITNKLYEENKQLDKDAMYWIDRAYEYKQKLEAIRAIYIEFNEKGNELGEFVVGWKKIWRILNDE